MLDHRWADWDFQPASPERLAPTEPVLVANVEAGATDLAANLAAALAREARVARRSVGKACTGLASATATIAGHAVSACSTWGTSRPESACLCVAAGGRERGNRRHEQRGRSGKRELPYQVATANVAKWDGSGPRLVKQAGFAELIDGKRHDVRIRRDLEPAGNFGNDFRLGPSTFFEQFHHTRSGRIEKMDLVIPRVVNENLLIKRVTKQASSYTRQRVHGTIPVEECTPRATWRF